jgi:hypothetical protein
MLDEIQTARINKNRGALLSLDIRKAFDTISHDFINQAFRFFNFGENFIKWINLIGTNRRACIILESGMYSKYFDLERGNAQGDTTSPYIFNIGYQILLLKLNFDLQIAGLIATPDVPPDLLRLAPDQQVGNYPRKVFAFADDGNLLTKMDFNSLSRVKTILKKFGDLSGLECNVEKTILMQFGDTTPISQEIKDLGFSIDNSVTVLGLKIKSNNLNVQENWDKILEKVRGQVRNWTRFNLSLPGRVNIAKTMLYSQINYLGCFLEFPTELMDNISDLIESYVSGNLRIAKKRLYTSPKNGGIGLFEIETYLKSQRVAWIARSLNLDEIWKIKLFIAGKGNILNVRSSFLSKEQTPILHGIVLAYESFLSGFTKYDENFWNSAIFENGALFVKLREKKVLSKDFFSEEFFAEHENKILNWTIMDFYSDKDTMKTRETFCTDNNINLERNDFNALKAMASTAKLKYSKKDPNEKKTCTISDFLRRGVKGCKRYRKRIIGKEEENVPHNIVKFASNTETVIGYENSKKLNNLWNTSFFSNETRTFLFKLHNNTLGYNNAVAHFVPGHSPNCTFCDIVGNQDVEDETPLHLLFSCRISENFIDEIFSWFLGERANISRQEFFVTFNRTDHRKNEPLFIFAVLVKKYIWDCKQRFSLPNLENAKVLLLEELKVIKSINLTAKNILLNSGIATALG